MKRFFIVLLFLCFYGGFLGIKDAHASPSDNGRGFLWSDNFGWISLNCYNDWGDGLDSSQCDGPGGNYGVKIDLGQDEDGDFTLPGRMYGYAWSPYLGVICFGVSCGARALPDGGSPAITFNLNDAQVIGGERVVLLEGWARVIAHKDQGVSGGWIKFSGRNGQDTAIQVGMRGGEGGEVEIRGAAWQRNSNGSGIGWIYFGPSPPGGVPEDAQGNAGDDEEIRLPPPFGCEAREICGGTPTDDDCDYSYTGAPDDNPLTGRDCQDYDCAGQSFYSSSVLVNGEPYCSVLIAGLEYYENVLSNDDCFDGVDNDLDHLIDCQDPDCANAELPAQGLMCGAEFAVDEFNFCFDGIDNDGDGLKDCNDEDCRDHDVCNGDNILIDHEQCGQGGSLEGRCAEFCPGFEPRPGLVGDGDEDNDNICDNVDSCLKVSNPTQVDNNGNGIGDECDAFLETQQGSIYASRIRIAKPPKQPIAAEDKYTATYCILASAQGLAPFNAESKSCQLPSGQAVSEFRLRQYRDTVALLPSFTQKTLLSYIDIAGLKNERYGVVSSLIEGGGVLLSDYLRSGNARVFYSAGDLDLSEQDITIPANRGAVTVLVEGNLTFGRNTKIVYEPVNATLGLKQIASIAWVVIDPDLNDNNLFGNIIIDPSVIELAGAMFAANTILTGNGFKQLTLKGLMAARSFDFQREYRPIEVGDEVKSAELIIYDGRAAINPPPGLADFVKALPTFRSVAPR